MLVIWHIVKESGIVLCTHLIITIKKMLTESKGEGHSGGSPQNQCKEEDAEIRPI